MKNLRDSANIVRSMARQYQAVIDLAEHVGEGDKLESDLEQRKKALEEQNKQLLVVNGKIGYAEDKLRMMGERIAEKQKEIDTQAGAHAEKLVAHETQRKQFEDAELQAGRNMETKIKRLDAAQAQLLEIQGTINERKEELARLQAKINEVQKALTGFA